MTNLKKNLAKLKKLDKKIILIGSAVTLTLLTAMLSTNRASKKANNIDTTYQLPTDFGSDDSAQERINKLIVDNKNKELAINAKLKEIAKAQQDADQKRNIELREIKSLIKSGGKVQIKDDSLTAAQIKDLIREEFANINPGPSITPVIPLGNSSDEEVITWIEDIVDMSSIAAIKNNNFSGSVTNQKIPTIPRYTIAQNATLMDSILLTPLIGRVPVMGKITSPYPFKLMVGTNNLISNGIELPDIEGIVAQGEAVGDMALKCASGKVYSLTFTFKNGEIVTKNGTAGKPIGFISSENGNVCIPGKFITNAAEFLATQSLLSATEGAANAFSEAQTSINISDNGNERTNITGSAKKLMLGRAVANSADSVADWHMKRIQDSFDVVYVPQATKIAVHIERELAIDLGPNRKVIYEDDTTTDSNELD